MLQESQLRGCSSPKSLPFPRQGKNVGMGKLPNGKRSPARRFHPWVMERGKEGMLPAAAASACFPQQELISSSSLPFSAKEAGGKQSRALTLCNTPGSIGEQFAQRSPQPRPMSPSVSPSPPQGPCGAGGEGLGPGGPQMGPGCSRVPRRARGGGGGSSGVPGWVSRSQPPPAGSKPSPGS